mgnify:CR=1 FL=1
MGPKEAPNAPHAFSTISIMACAPLPLELAIRKAIADSISTRMRLTISVSFSVAFLRKKGLYRSAVKELDATNSWESAVEMEAAMMAASSRPQIAAGKNLRDMAMNTNFWPTTQRP